MKTSDKLSESTMCEEEKSGMPSGIKIISVVIIIGIVVSLIWVGLKINPLDIFKSKKSDETPISMFGVSPSADLLELVSKSIPVEEGVVHSQELYFEPNQNIVASDAYKVCAQLIRAFRLNKNTIIIIEGYSDPTRYLIAKQNGTSAKELNDMLSASKNLSLQRAETMKRYFLEYCESYEIAFDVSKIVLLGYGMINAKYPFPETEQQWKENMRIVVKLKSIEG